MGQKVSRKSENVLSDLAMSVNPYDISELGILENKIHAVPQGLNM